MASIPWLIDVLRAAGVQVVEEGNWRARGVSGSFNPIGVLWHHTAAKSSPTNPAPALNTVINGRSDLQGPLCHALVDYNGVFHLVSANRANHAGAARASGPIPAGDGNTMLIGWEIDYDGVNQHMTPAQYTESLKATAAVLRQLGHDASYARGHRETSTTGKIDPSFIDLDVMRADVAALIAGGGAVPGQSYRYGEQQHFAAVSTGGTLTNLSWSPSTNIVRPDWGGGTLVGKPVGYIHNNQQHVFARGTDNTIRHWWQAGDGNPVLDDWGTAGRVMSNPSGFAYGGQQHLFYRNPDGNLEHKFWDQGTDQITTGVWAGGPFVGNPFAFVHKDQQHIFARDEAGALKHGTGSPAALPATTTGESPRVSLRIRPGSPPAPSTTSSSGTRTANCSTGSPTTRPGRSSATSGPAGRSSATRMPSRIGISNTSSPARRTATCCISTGPPRSTHRPTTTGAPSA